MTFGEVIKMHRERLGWTQSMLGMRVGRDATRVSKVEQGHTFRKLPDPDEFRLWADALGVSPEEMLQQMRYIGEQRVLAGPKPPELVFATLAEEIHAAETLPPEVKDMALTGLKHARLFYESQRRHAA